MPREAHPPSADPEARRWLSRALSAFLVLVAVGMVMSAGSARAQLSEKGGNGPIDITADSTAFENAACKSTWSGAAEVLQGDSRLRANVITAYLKKKAAPAPGAAAATASVQNDPGAPGSETGAGCGATERIEADGDVFYVTPSQTARGDHAVYTAADGLIVMTGNVIVVQGKDVIHGDRMTLQVATHQVQFDSVAKGRGTPGRVRGVFFPNQPGQPGVPGLSAPAAAAAPASR